VGTLSEVMPLPPGQLMVVVREGEKEVEREGVVAYDLITSISSGVPL
jgi:hypothetical protein